MTDETPWTGESDASHWNFEEADDCDLGYEAALPGLQSLVADDMSPVTPTPRSE